MSTLLVDIGPLGSCCSDRVLETMHKSLSEGEGEGIFAKHHSSYVADLIEEVYGHGTKSLNGLSQDLLSWLQERAEKKFTPIPTPDRFLIWSPEKGEKVFTYLSRKPRINWSAADYMLMVDYLVYSWFPETMPGVMADLAAKKGAIMGKIQAVHEGLTPGEAVALLSYLSKPAQVASVLSMAEVNEDIIAYGMAHCSDAVTGFTDGMRHQIKRLILDHEKGVRLGGVVRTDDLQTKLFDAFADFNRDWRRIAVTEVGEMANQGFIAGLEPGKKVKRVEQYLGACPFCLKIDGVVALVVDPRKADKNWDTEIWAGKDNVGRSASPYKRVGGALVKRSDEELWKLPAGLAHPHCRGTWISLDGPAIDDTFTLWLDGMFRQGKG